MEDPDMRFRFLLAEHLHKTVGELGSMPCLEFKGWEVYLANKKK